MEQSTNGGGGQIWFEQFIAEEFEWYNQIDMEIGHPGFCLAQPSLGDGEQV